LIINVRTASKVNVIQLSSVDPSNGKYLDQRGGGDQSLHCCTVFAFNLTFYTVYLCIII